MKSFFSSFVAICALVLCLASCQKERKIVETASFETFEVDSVCTLFKNYEKPCCHISIKMEVPQHSMDDDTRMALERFITSIAKDGALEDAQSTTVQEKVESYVRQYVMDYLSQGPDAIASYGEDMNAAATWMNYEETFDGKVIYNSKGLICYQVSTYSYTGGAHGSNSTDNGVFDLNTLSQINLVDVFDYSVMSSVNHLLQQKLAEDNGCETIEELAKKEIFFNPSEIEITDNFQISDEGFCWVYDPCDIAPFSVGEVKVSMSWDELYPYISAESPLMKLAQQNEE